MPRILHDTTLIQQGAPLITAWVDGEVSGRIELGGDCLSFEVSKDINSPMGTFTIDILPRADLNSDIVALRGGRTGMERLAFYMRVLELNTPISIGFDREGGIMLGLIGSVDYTSMVADGKLSIGLKIQGTDFGYVLDDHILNVSVATAEMSRWVDNISAVLGPDAPVLSETTAAEGPLNAQGVRTTLLQPVEKMAEYTIRRVQGMRIPVLQAAFGGTGKVGDYCGVRASSFSDDLVFKPLLYQQSATVRQFLEETIDRDFYTLQMETLPRDGQISQPVLVVAPKPFDETAFSSPAWAPVTLSASADWDQHQTFVEGLPHHEISTGDVTGQLQIGRSRDEAFSFYTVQNNNELGATGADATSGASYPLYDLFTATRFNTTRYDSRVSLVPGDSTETGMEETVNRSVQTRRNRLFNWYRANPWFLSGAIQVRGNDNFRAGDPVFIPWLEDPLSEQLGVRFYCTAVSYSWSVGAPYECSLHLSRGHGPGFFEAFVAKKVQPRMPASVPYGWTSADR